MSETSTAGEIASAAMACWRAGDDERDGPRRIETIITRLVSALTTRLAEKEAALQARDTQLSAELERADELRERIGREMDRAVAAETRLAEAERKVTAKRKGRGEVTSLPSWVIEAAESIRRMEGDTFQSIKVDHKTLEWAEAIWRAYEAREGSWEQRRDGTGMAGGSGR